MILAQHAAHEQQLADRDTQLSQAHAIGDQLRAELDRLRSKLVSLLRKNFGRSSEKLAAQIEQLQLALEEVETSGVQAGFDITPTPPSQTSPPVRRPLPEHLPREEVVYQPACQCEHCGGSLKAIGDDVAEMLEFVPASFKVIRRIRPKFSCTACQRIIQQPAPSRPINRGLAGPGLLAHVAVSKFADHLPLYRQSQIYARQGVELERSTLAD